MREVGRSPEKNSGVAQVDFFGKVREHPDKPELAQSGGRKKNPQGREKEGRGDSDEVMDTSTFSTVHQDRTARVSERRTKKVKTEKKLGCRFSCRSTCIPRFMT